MSVFGSVFGTVFGSVFGGIGPSSATVTVRATRRGLWAGALVEPGQTFTITAPGQYSPYWMAWVDAVPLSWLGYLAVYSARTDEELLDPLTRTEVAAKLAQRPGPYTKAR